MTEPRISLEPLVDGFSGVVRVSAGGAVLYERWNGLADRDRGLPIDASTRFGIASGSKGFTALTVMSLVEDGSISLQTLARDLIGDRLPLMDERTTVEHLLAHTSGIGEYIEESDIEDIDHFVLPVPVDRLVATSDYLVLIRDRPSKFPPGERFEYSDSGYVALALIVEAVTGQAFHDVVHDRVFAPAEMTATSYTRLDELTEGDARGYVPAGSGWRTNSVNLPVRGSGDGGALSTLADIAAFWDALFDGRIVPLPTVERMVAPRNEVPKAGKSYGLGFWLRADRPTVMLEGYDAGVSFRSAHDRPSGLQYTVMSNTSRGAWPLVKVLDRLLPELAR